MQIFYCGNQYATKIETDSRTSVFRLQQITLAVCRDSLPVKLQAVDSQCSALGSLSPDHFEPMVFSPYGSTYAYIDTTGFKGEPIDTTTGNYLLGNGHRAYSPVNQRFNCPDSYSPFSLGGLNCYVFVGNDPINSHDPTGRFVGHANPFMVAARAMTSLKNQLTKLFFPSSQFFGGKGRKVDGIVAFSADSLSGGSSRVYIYGHGGPDYINGESRSYDGPALYRLFENNGIPLNGRETFLLACRSAAMDPSSGLALNQSLANKTGAASIGFQRKVKVEISSDNEFYQAEVMPPELIELYLATHTDRSSTALPQPRTASRIAAYLRRS